MNQRKRTHSKLSVDDKIIWLSFLWVSQIVLKWAKSSEIMFIQGTDKSWLQLICLWADIIFHLPCCITYFTNRGNILPLLTFWCCYHGNMRNYHVWSFIPLQTWHDSAKRILLNISSLSKFFSKGRNVKPKWISCTLLRCIKGWACGKKLTLRRVMVTTAMYNSNKDLLTVL